PALSVHWTHPGTVYQVGLALALLGSGETVDQPPGLYHRVDVRAVTRLPCPHRGSFDGVGGRTFEPERLRLRDAQRCCPACAARCHASVSVQTTRHDPLRATQAGRAASRDGAGT